MDISSQFYFDTPDEARELLVMRFAKLYVFNLLVIADETDEGGLDHPLPESHIGLQPIIDTLLNDGLIQVEPYDEGEEYVPTDKASAFLQDVIRESESWKSKPAEGLDQVRKAFFKAMDSGAIKHIDESELPWYKEIMRFRFYEKLAPQDSPQTPPSNETANSAISINQAPEQRPEATYLYKKPTFIGLVCTLVFFALTQVISGILMWIPVILSVIATIYFGSKKIIVNQHGVQLKSLIDQKHIGIDDIEEFTYEEEDGDASSFEILGRNGQQITISSWVDDFNGLKHYLVSLKDQQYKS